MSHPTGCPRKFASRAIVSPIEMRKSVGRRYVANSLLVAARAVFALLIMACSTRSDAQPPVPSPSLATAEPLPSGPVVTTAGLVTVAKGVMAPSGTLCDTHRDAAPSDVNACPYTDRLKARVNALYRQAWSGAGNSNPVLSSGPPCSPSNPTVVSYFAKPSAAGGDVSLVTACGTPEVDASTSWQKLVIVSVNGSLLVDDILIDRAHTGGFVSVYV